MAFRGRGRGRGGGGYTYGGNHYAKQEPVLLYPDSIPLPPSAISQDKDLAFLTRSNISLQNFFESSPYNLNPQQSLPKSHETSEIERYSDRFKPKTPSKRLLSDYINLDPRNFPRELIQGGGRKRGGFDQKKVNWNDDSAKLRKLDIFEKLEEKFGDRDEEEKKEGEEEEDEVENAEDEEEESENDDYGHMLHDFQDDEDEFNLGGYSEDEEATFEL